MGENALKILFLHLSDIHIEKSKDISEENINGIIRSLNSIERFDEVVFIVSGDIAYSGSQDQYNTAWKLFNNLRRKIRNKYNVGEIEILVVPGNHDVNYSLGKLTHIDLENIFNKNLQEQKILEEHRKIKSFYNFAHGCKSSSAQGQLAYKKILTFNGYSIQVNLINSAPFSSLEEDQGLHYISEEALKYLETEEDEVDLIISVMHHPHHWYHISAKKQLERLLYTKSALIFVGHEHYIDSYDVMKNGEKVKILAGGQLCNKGDWSVSEYFAGILDTNKNEYILYAFNWDNNSKSKLYIKTYIDTYTLNRRNNKLGFRLKEEYIKDMFNDVKHMISSDFTNYYVFPRLEQVTDSINGSNKIINNLDEFLKELAQRKKIVIVGHNDSGKTSCLKYILRILSQEKVVLFCKNDNISNYNRVIKEAFEDSYSRNSVDYTRFEQLDPKNKVLIIDDLHNVDMSYLESFMRNAESDFEYIIYSSNKVIDFDLKELIKRRIIEKGYTRYQIKSFYKDKREKLISNIVRLIIKEDCDRQERIISSLCTTLKKQKTLFNMDPDFIIQFTKYYCNNIGDTIQNDGEIFSKVFDANIVSLITPFAKKISVDKIMILLDKIAYVVHTEKKHPIGQEDIFNVIRQYNDDFNSNVNFSEFLQILCNANIISVVNNGSKYKFTNRNYLAYFVAREIRRKCLQENDYYEFENIINYSCFGINANILLFVTYITDNINIIRMIMDKVNILTEKWDEVNIDKIDIPYLVNVGKLKVKAPAANDKKRMEENEINEENQLEDEKENQSEDIYNYKEEKDIKLIDQMIKAVSLLGIVSRCLPSFEHMMPRNDKIECVRLIYTIPSKIFHLWANEVERNKEDLIQELKEYKEWDYRRDKYTDDDSILNYLKWQSLSLFLEIMNTSIGNATKENTKKYLDEFEFSINGTYEIEHLMVLQKQDIYSEFSVTAITLYEEKKSYLAKLLIQRIVKNYMYSSKHIKREQIQHLGDKLWNGKFIDRQLLIAKKDDKNKR